MAPTQKSEVNKLVDHFRKDSAIYLLGKKGMSWRRKGDKDLIEKILYYVP